MKIEKARELKTDDYVIRGRWMYRVEISVSNEHDLWFWQVRKSDRQMKTPGIVNRVYLGSKNIEPSGVEFLEGLVKVSRFGNSG